MLFLPPEFRDLNRDFCRPLLPGKRPLEVVWLQLHCIQFSFQLLCTLLQHLFLCDRSIAVITCDFMVSYFHRNLILVVVRHPHWYRQKDCSRLKLHFGQVHQHLAMGSTPLQTKKEWIRLTTERFCITLGKWFTSRLLLYTKNPTPPKVRCLPSTDAGCHLTYIRRMLKSQIYCFTQGERFLLHDVSPVLFALLF